jgi:hypothetical protein
MCRYLATLAVCAAVGFTIGAAPSFAAADPNVVCHKTVVKQLEKFKKTHLKVYRNCLDKLNRNLIPGPCLDAKSALKLSDTQIKVAESIAKKCTPATLSALGYRTDCQYGASTAGVGGTCFALPASTPTEFANCMMCWKGAEFSRYIGTLYASHATDTCGVALDDTSLTCSAVGCTSPLPTQRNLGDTGENDCQRMMAKAALNYLLKREKILDKCMLLGNSYATCLADVKVDLQLDKAEIQKQTLINKFCNNFAPVADPPFCCRTGGPMQQCVVAATRQDCIDLGGTHSVSEDRVCDMGSCANIAGPGKSITWWEHCPNNEPCPGPTLGDIDGVIQCVDDIADEVVGNVLCLQFPNGGACTTPTPAETPTPTPTSTP